MWSDKKQQAFEKGKKVGLNCPPVANDCTIIIIIIVVVVVVVVVAKPQKP